MMENEFKLPIFYNNLKTKLSDNIKTDLELDKINVSNELSQEENTKPIYSHVFKSSDFISEMSEYYTTDIDFLKDTQQMIKSHEVSSNKCNYDVKEILNEIMAEKNFKEKYNYVEWDFLDFLNRTPAYLQSVSIYNILSPILALAVPIMMMIIPFFILKMKGLIITIKEYTEELKKIMINHAIGRLFFVDFKNANFKDLSYFIFTALFWIYSVYQNFSNSFKFNKNMCQICKYISVLNSYVEFTIQRITKHMKSIEEIKCDAYKIFLSKLQENYNILIEMQTKLNSLSTYSFNMLHVHKIQKNGDLLNFFYDLRYLKKYNLSLQYSLKFNNYMDCIDSLKSDIENKKLNYAIFEIEKKNEKKNKKKNEKTRKSIKDNCYVPLNNQTPNDVNLNKNYIITGPNASGKTTVLKSVLINLILTQQFGCGYYSKYTCVPYNYFHSYLNIPDTSGRDSLFQAEARRCKEIIDLIQNSNKNETHFCIFDELYSGTNPDEALSSGINFIKYISKRKNVSFMLTTHFIKLCNEKYENTENFKMKTEIKNKNENVEEITYLYILEKGISSIKGGNQVLKKLEYPTEFFT